MTLANSVQISQPLYVRGNLCLNNSARVLSTASPVSVAGTIQITSSATVGVSGTPVAELHVGGGCRYGTSGPFTGPPCTPAQGVYATTQDATRPVVSKPPVDLAYWYSRAKPGPLNPCTTGSFPGGFDTDATLNRSRPAVNLLQAAAYDCTVTQGATTVGRLAWNPATNALTIQGVVFFDGDIFMNGSQKIQYTGRGTIYASGRIDLAGSQQICGAMSGGNCNFTTGAWDPTANLLVLVAGSTTDDPSFTLGQSMRMQAALYAARGYTQGSSVRFQGPVVAESLSITSSSQAQYMPLSALPPGMPAARPAIRILPGTWTG